MTAIEFGQVLQKISEEMIYGSGGDINEDGTPTKYMYKDLKSYVNHELNCHFFKASCSYV